MGFTINTISLFGLVLAIGLVVDDAIVVVEMCNGISPRVSSREATKIAMKEVTAPVIATTLVLLAVFVPSAFTPGITGRLFVQFAATISDLRAAVVNQRAYAELALCAAILEASEKSIVGPLAWFWGWKRPAAVTTPSCVT